MPSPEFGGHMRRREFITLLGGTTASSLSWPLGVRAQQAERMRRIGILLPAAANDADFQTWVGAFLQALAQLDWTIGRNVRIDTRWATANAAEIRKHAAELAALTPDVILASGSSTVGPLLQATRDGADRVSDRRRSGRCRLRRQPGAAGRQCHRFPPVRIQPGREMAGAAQAGRARRDASGGTSGSRLSLRDRPVRCDPGRGAVARGGG